MPTLEEIAKMGKSKVYKALQKIHSSRYHEMSVDHIRLVTGGYNNAIKYLHELALAADMKRSDLFAISEKNSSDEKSSNLKGSKSLIGSLSSAGLKALFGLSSSSSNMKNSSSCQNSSSKKESNGSLEK